MQSNIKPDHEQPSAGSSPLEPAETCVDAIAENSPRQGFVSALLARVMRGRGIYALTDQMLVSGSNFITGIVLVRGLGLSDFGKFSIAYALLLYANALQMSLVASPMLSIAPLLPNAEKRKFVDGMLVIQIIASLLLFGAFALIGVIAHFFTSFYSLPCIFAFAFCVGTFQLQDWLRRFYFLYGKGKLGLANDFISYGGQLAVLTLLWRLHHLSLLLTFVVMCATSVAALVMGPLTDRIRPSTQGLRQTWKRCKSFSLDLLVASQVRWLGYQGVLLIGAWIVGTKGIGGLRATQSLAGPIYLLLISLENYLPMRVADEIKAKGAPAAVAFIRRAIIGGIFFFILLVTPVAIFGRQILRIVYGPDLVAFYVPMLLTLAYFVIAAGTAIWLFLLRGLQDTRSIWRASALTSITNIVGVYFLGHFWGPSGIVMTTVVGQIAMGAYYWFHWARNGKELLEKSSARLRQQARANVPIEGEFAQAESISS